MKKTQWIELFRTIGKTVVSFFSVVLFASMAIAAYVGMNWSGRAFLNSFDAEFDKYKLRDVEAIAPLGYSNEDIEKISEIEGVTYAEGLMTTYRFYHEGADVYQAKIVSITENVDQLNQIEGTLPTKAGEIALQKHYAESHDYKLGDEITFEEFSLEKKYPFIKEIIEPLSKIYPEISEDLLIKDLKTDTFTITAFVESPAYASTFSTTYGSDPINSTAITTICFTPEESFGNLLFGRYSSCIMYCDELTGYRTGSDEYVAHLEEVTERISTAINAQTVDVSEKTDEIIVKVREILDPVYGEETEYKQFWEEFDKEEVIDTAKQLFTSVCLNRRTNAGFVAADISVSVTGKLGTTLSIVFIIIGAFVCFTAISRIVYEQSKLIGTKKALGFTNGEITSFFLLYSAIAVIISSILGAILGRFVFETLFFSAISNIFRIESKLFMFDIVSVLMLSLVEAVVILVATYIACTRTLKRNTLSLLTEATTVKAKKRFFEKTKLWKKTPLLTKTIINNIFNDKRRVFSTLISIIGCCALTVTACTLYFDVVGSFDKQFNEINSFDYVVYFDTESETACDEIIKKAGDCPHSVINYRSLFTKTTDGNCYNGVMFVADDDAFDDLFKIYDSEGNRHSFREGAFINQSIVDVYGYKKGDIIEVVDYSGMQAQFEMEGVLQYYLTKVQIIMPADKYEEFFGEKYTPNAVIIDSNGRNATEFKTIMNSIDGVINVQDYFSENQKSFNSIGNDIKIIVLIYLVLAVAIGFLVILNVITMFISEKRRELINLMANGYTQKQVRKYITVDTVILVILGSIIGVALGMAIGKIAIMSFKNANCAFLDEISWQACLLGVAVTWVISFFMALIALRRMKKFKLTDANVDV